MARASAGLSYRQAIYCKLSGHLFLFFYAGQNAAPVVTPLPRIQINFMFGKFIKELRARQRLGLREFCLEHGHDPSNWSKIEREVLSPPRDEDTLRTWAKQLGLKQGSDDWLKFFDYAAVDAGRIPDHVLKDQELVEKLPAFFRTLSGQKPAREDLEKLLEIIRRASRP